MPTKLQRAITWLSSLGRTNAAQARTDLGLGSVDDTADEDKPISRAAAAAGVHFRQVSRDALNDAFAPPRAADVPVVTCTTGEATTISGGVLTREKRLTTSTSDLDVLGDTHFRYKGVPSAVDAYGPSGTYVVTPEMPGGAAVFARWGWCIEFETSAPEIEFKNRVVTASLPFWVMVNGRWVSETAIPRTTAAGTAVATKLTFPTAETRRIEVRFYGNEGFGGVWTTPGHTIVKPSQPITRSIAIIGDSVVASSGAAPTGAGPWETLALRVGYLMGADEVILAGIGSTGYITQVGSNPDSVFGGRIPAILAMPNGAPDVVVFVGSQNDAPHTGDGGTAIQAAVEGALAQVAAVPEVYVFGPWLPNTIIVSAVQAGALAAGRPSWDISGDVYGTGKLGSTTGDGNADFFKNADTFHPTHAGHKFLARNIYARLLGDPPKNGALGFTYPTLAGYSFVPGSATVSLAGNFTTSGAYASTFTFTGATSVTFPTSGTLATTSSTEPTITAGTTAQFWRGDKSWVTLNQAAVAGLGSTDFVQHGGMRLEANSPTFTIYDANAASGGRFWQWYTADNAGNPLMILTARGDDGVSSVVNVGTITRAGNWTFAGRISAAIPAYADDAAADADSALTSGSLYRTTGGGRAVFQKP